MTFETLGLIAPLIKAVEKQNYTKPTAIQQKAIPPILLGRDILASAQTGTGKTAGFTLPLLQILSQSEPLRRRPIRALILTPTRELAAQVHESIRTYSEFLNLRSTVIFGGVNAKPQISTLSNGVDILVATPGRLLDLHTQRIFSLAKVEFFVLDEADRMLDMGFARDVNKILQLMPAKRQNLLFSATFSKEIKTLASGFLQNPVTVEATPENSTVEKIAQKAYHVGKIDKTDLLIKLIKDGEWKQILIFTRTKSGANRLGKKLNKRGILAAEIHGDKSQNARVKALDNFKKGTITALVATDVAARGLDIPLLPYVVNFELPNIPEDYVHRIGRTGRAGANGVAVSLVSHDEMDYLRDIEKLLKHKVSLEIIEGFEPGEATEEDLKPAKKSFGRGGGKTSSDRSAKPKQAPRNRPSNKVSSESTREKSKDNTKDKAREGSRDSNRDSSKVKPRDTNKFKARDNSRDNKPRS